MENKEMTTREKISTGLGLAIGGAGLIILYSEILSKAKIEKHKGMTVTMLALLVAGAVGGGYLGNKLGKKWQAHADEKKIQAAINKLK